MGAVRLVSEAWKRLLRNLLDNALVQPAEVKAVAVSVRLEDGFVVTRVADQGPGVSPGNREKVFRRFFSARPAGAPAGTGLGLSIVAAVAQAHGGRVELAPQGERTGAAFDVFLPSSPPPFALAGHGVGGTAVL